MEPAANLDSFVIMKSNIEMLPPDNETLKSAVDGKVQLKYNSAIAQFCMAFSGGILRL